jgi:hypothetical protein
VRRSGRDEPTWVIIQMCMETMIGISLYHYLYFKLAKILCLSYYLLWFLFNNFKEQEGGTGSAQKGEAAMGVDEGEATQIMYTHMNKCKNDKMKN